jgi:hypothetical protein
MIGRWRIPGALAAWVLATMLSLANAATFQLQPVADAYVRNSAATTNLGSDVNFIANNGNGIRVSFVRFDLSAITEPITSAKLDLTVAIGSSGQDFNVYGLTTGESWSETGITWNNAPAVVTGYTTTTGTVADYLKTSDLFGGGTVLGNFISGAAGAVDAVFNVTSGTALDFLNADADRIVTFVIAEPGASDASGVGWNSREATVGKPLLTVTTGAVEPPPPPPPPASPTLLRVVLVAGQSNADGRAAGSGLPTSPVNYQAPLSNVPFYYYTHGAAANGDGTLGSLTTLRPGATQMPAGGFGPEIALGHALAPIFEQQSGTGLAIIKYAKGGSNLHTDWKAGGSATTAGDGVYYQTFQRVVRDGLARLQAAHPNATVKLAGMIWVQGESDIDGGSSTSGAYGANLTNFIADVRATFDATLPFFFSRISANQTVYSNPADPNYPDYLTLRAQQAQVAASVPAAYMIDTDGPAVTMNGDNLHFNAAGQLALGGAFAAQMGNLLRLRVTHFEAHAGGFRLRWNALPGKSYRVSTSPDLLDWTPQSVGVVSEWTDTAGAGGPCRFYKVAEEN